MAKSDPDARLKRFRAEHDETMMRRARLEENLAIRNRVANLWIHLEGHEKAELTPERVGRWLVLLANSLAGFGMESALQRITPNDDGIQEEILDLVRQAAESTDRTRVESEVTERLQELAMLPEHWSRFLRGVVIWLKAAVLEEGSRCRDGAASEAPPSAGPPSSATGAAPPPDVPAVQLTAVERAMQIFARDPNQSVGEIARQVGCDRSLLYRDPRFKRLREAYRGTLPKGSKSRDGELEAEAED